jgi:putative tricarboxylic transport membrane protein
VLANAALITTARLHPELHAVLHAGRARLRGPKASAGTAVPGSLAIDADVTGCLIAAPAFWLFTKLLAINLPGLTGTGWL